LQLARQVTHVTATMAIIIIEINRLISVGVFVV